MAAILCGCECHDVQPQLGTVKTYRDPTAPFGYLCIECSGRWDTYFAAHGLERRYPIHHPVTKRHPRCPGS